MRRLHRTLVLFLLAWLPLQSMGVPLVAGCCADAAAAVATEASPCHEHAALDADAIPAEDGQGGTHENTHENPGHLCCPHFSAATVQGFAFAGAATRFEVAAPPLAVRSHVPEQPQRPPRP